MISFFLWLAFTLMLVADALGLAGLILFLAALYG